MNEVERAARAIERAGGLLVGAGAGMGVDSGLPDFRGPRGLWRAFPPAQALRLSFEDLASPRWFHDDPALAWGFYGWRLAAYREAVPHEGFRVLRDLGARVPGGTFVFTSNVDGHFQKAGFDDARIAEVHGSIHVLQCTRFCGTGLFSADGLRVEIDPGTFRALPPLPACPRCGALARPNVLMFGDPGWDPARTEAQEERLSVWLRSQDPQRLVVVECGAGTAVPTVRFFCERLARSGATLVRINLREAQAPDDAIAIAGGAAATLRAIAAAMAT